MTQTNDFADAADGFYLYEADIVIPAADGARLRDNADAFELLIILRCLQPFDRREFPVAMPSGWCLNRLQAALKHLLDTGHLVLVRPPSDRDAGLYRLAE